MKFEYLIFAIFHLKLSYSSDNHLPTEIPDSTELLENMRRSYIVSGWVETNRVRQCFLVLPTAKTRACGVGWIEVGVFS